MDQPLCVGLALGAGGARGLAHIGVLQVLQEEKIPVHVLAGTSMGAVIGGLYAADADLSILERLLGEIGWEDLVNPAFARTGLVSSARIHELLRVLTKQKTFSELTLPFAVVATDLRTGKEVVIREGPIADGIRASLSVPFVFVPVEKEELLLSDGALVNRVPVSVAKDLGAHVVIAVDVGFPPMKAEVTNLVGIMIRVVEILERECSRRRGEEADLLITPRLSDVSITDLGSAAYIIEEGRRATYERLADLRVLLDRSGESLYNLRGEFDGD